jgi:hypothetical protein
MTRSQFYPVAAILLLWASNVSAQIAFFNIPNGNTTALKNAIAASNADNETDIITLAANGTYTLTAADNATNGPNGLPVIGSDNNHPVIIHGNGAVLQRSTVANTPAFRVLYVGSGANVSIDNLEISHGLLASPNLGAGIYNDHGQLTLMDSLVRFNTSPHGAAGILNNGETGGSASLTLINTGIAGNTSTDANSGGAGIFSDGSGGSASLVMTNCNFNFNSVGALGGGLYNTNCGLTVTDCTFQQNSAQSTGAGVYIQQSVATISDSTFFANQVYSPSHFDVYGGAIFNGLQSTTTLSNCTFDANSAGVDGDGSFSNGAGIYNFESTLSSTNCTFSRGDSTSTGASIYNDVGTGTASVTLANNIFQTTSSGGNLGASSGSTFISQGHNLSSDNGAGFLTGPGDQINTDPKFNPSGLQFYGGPTQTIALLSNSTAINSGDDTKAPSRDQRHYTRSGVSDIGAYEFGGRLTPLTAVSRKNHAGPDFDLNLPLTGANGVECRRNTGADTSGNNAGHDHQVIVTFPFAVAIDSATADHSVTVDALSTGFNQTYTLNLHNVSNAVLVTLTLNNVHDNTNSFTDTISMGVLLGDVNGDNFVLSGDYTAVRQRSGAAVDGTNFQYDINVDGFVLSGDYTTARQQSGSHLSPQFDPSTKLRLRER